MAGLVIVEVTPRERATTMTGKNVNAVVSLAKEAITGDAEGLKD